MNGPFPLIKWYGSRAGVTGALLVLLTAMALGLYVSGVYVDSSPPVYSPDFGNAQWITPPQAQAVGYFRKNLYVPQTVRHAWLLVTAPDSFNVYINNSRIPGSDPVSRRVGATAALIPGSPTALIDITPYLKRGTNTVAVFVMSSSYGRNAALRVRGTIHYDMASQDFISNESWRASSYSGVLKDLIPWTDPTLDDVHWPLARTFTPSQVEKEQPLTVPPWLFQEPLKSHWICSFAGSPQRSTFSTVIQAPPDYRDGWLQISSTGKNKVLLNGHVVADSSQQSDVADSSSDTSIHFFWIQPWLKAGSNDLVVRVDDPRESPTLLAQLSYQDGAGGIHHAVSDGTWNVQGLTGFEEKAVDLGLLTYNGKTTLSLPPRQNYPTPFAASTISNQAIEGWFWGIAVAVIVLIVHLLVSDRMVARGTLPATQALSLDAILHLPVLLLLGVLALLNYDADLQPEWLSNSAWLGLILAAWVGLRWWVLRRLDKKEEAPVAGVPPFFAWIGAEGFTLALATVTFIAFALRLAGIDLFSLDQDETLVYYAAQGVWARGYPSVENHGEIVRLTTYELLPYPVALSALFFGWSDWSVRIPALLFGTFTAWNLGRMGRELFGPLVGLLTAACYTVIPWDVYYARHCLHPAQTQFFALLCFWSFYRAISVPDAIEKKEFYKCCLFFVCTYLTWEGSAFILPVLALMLLIMHPGRWGWLRQLHVYVGLAFVAMVVILQLVNRGAKPSYLMLGFGLTNLSPSLVFLDQTGITNFYATGILLEQCHIILVICMLFGLFFIFESRPLRYVLLLFGLLLFAYSNFLPVYTSRYFFFYQSLLVLGACASLVYLCRAVFDLGMVLPLATVRKMTASLLVAAAAFVLFISSTFFLRLLNFKIQSEDTSTRYGLYSSEAGAACRYVRDHLLPGDFVSGNFNYSYYHQSGKYVDFTLNQYLGQLSIFDPDSTPFGEYQNIYVRIQSLLNQRDFARVFSRCKRLWYIAYLGPTNGNDVIHSAQSYVLSRSRVVYSGYNVSVYLAEGMPTKAGEKIPDLGLPPSPPLGTVTTQATVAPRTKP